MKSKGRKPHLHFSRADSTERGSFVKALRCASTAGAALTSAALTMLLTRSCPRSAYRKNEEKNWERARATAKPKPFIPRYRRKTYTKQTVGRPTEIEQTLAHLRDLLETHHQICDEIQQGLATMRANVQHGRELRRISQKTRQIRKTPQPAKAFLRPWKKETSPSASTSNPQTCPAGRSRWNQSSTKGRRA